CAMAALGAAYNARYRTASTAETPRPCQTPACHKKPLHWDGLPDTARFGGQLGPICTNVDRNVMTWALLLRRRRAQRLRNLLARWVLRRAFANLHSVYQH